MQLVFVDDSGTNTPPREHLGELVSVGAVMFPEDQVAAYSRKVDSFRAEIGMPAEAEFKWNSPRGSFLASAGAETVKRARCRLLEIAAECEVKTSVIVWDRGQVPWPKEQIAQEILGYLYERIEMHLSDREERGIIVADIPGGGNRDHSKWLADALDLTTSGTKYINPKGVVMPIVTAPSDHVPHLQLADLVTAATTAAVAGRNSGMELVNLLKPLARRNNHNLIGGAGLVLWPPQLNDLFYWVLGETVYMRQNVNISLGPEAEFWSIGSIFHLNDGLPS